jgi:hypothetical protein
MDDEIHDLDRGVDDAQLFGGAGEGAAEELVVQLDDQIFCLAWGSVMPCDRSLTLA